MSVTEATFIHTCWAYVFSTLLLQDDLDNKRANMRIESQGDPEEMAVAAQSRKGGGGLMEESDMSDREPSLRADQIQMALQHLSY